MCPVEEVDGRQGQREREQRSNRHAGSIPLASRGGAGCSRRFVGIHFIHLAQTRGSLRSQGQGDQSDEQEFDRRPFLSNVAGLSV
jgi:hypothetical protein